MSTQQAFTPTPAAAAYVGERFGLAGTALGAEPTARGLCGRIWELTAAGTRHALKELFWDDDQDEREIRGRVRFETAARAAGVGCPQSLPTVDGDYLCRLPPELGDVYVRLYGWIDGRPLTPADRAAEQAADWLGDCLARLHRLALRDQDAGAPDSRFERVPTADQWQELLDALRAQRVGWADRLERLMPAVGELSELVVPLDRDALIMCHLDLTPENVMRERTGGFVLVDWDNAGPGSADHELAAALMAWHAPDGRARTDRVAATAAAYARAGGPGRVRDLSCFSGYLGTVLNNLYTQASVAIAADTREEHRELARTKVRQVMANLPSRSALEQVGLSAETR
ncbi:phosphotransferase enzyme family protein [Streptomyces sp. CBMA123]|uniref:phosphotransferase enzyme family protein n=1 Tax=Streptomyces sp. CBMA123 TaxID=1896313 RepID=UPI001661C31A|nr:phosphotransferase [Streptomyces sp. CBMA123]MBD0692104.1 hypothetical protein [Streptomyces sp. CBMA123]